MSDTNGGEVTVHTATITVKVVRLDGRPMSLTMWRQVPEQGVVDDDGTLRGEPVGHVNYHAHECSDKDEHLHVLWCRQDGQPRQAYGEPPRHLGEPVRFGGRTDDERDVGSELLDALLLDSVLLDGWRPEPGTVRVHDHELAVSLPISERAFVVVDHDQAPLLRPLNADLTHSQREHLQLTEEMLDRATGVIARRTGITERLEHVEGQTIHRPQLAEVIHSDIERHRRGVEAAVAELRAREANLRGTWQLLSDLPQLYLTG